MEKDDVMAKGYHHHHATRETPAGDGTGESLWFALEWSSSAVKSVPVLVAVQGSGLVEMRPGDSMVLTHGRPCSPSVDHARGILLSGSSQRQHRFAGRIWTMDPLRVLFCISVALIYIIAPVTALGPLCGSALANSLAVVCADRGYYEQQPDIAVSPIVPRDVASTFLRSSGGAHHRQKRRPRTGKIVTECCENICTMAILESYCMRRPATEPPAHVPTTVREDNSVENVNSEQERERTESAEVTTSRNNGGSNERRTDDATPATNIERPTVLNPTDTSKSNRSAKHDRRRGKNNPDAPRTSTSSSKRNRTSKQSSREERRRNNSMERKASRELQRAISRERRKRLKQEKQERKSDKKKRRRMESAERSRGTDRNAPAEDITPVARESPNEQTRRTRSRSSNSRERLAHTLRTEEDELRRIQARRPQSRPSHSQPPSAQTTHAQEALSHRRQRSVWQKIRDNVLRHFR